MPSNWHTVLRIVKGLLIVISLLLSRPKSIVVPILISGVNASDNGNRDRQQNTGELRQAFQPSVEP